MEVKTINFQEEEPMTNLFQEFVWANPTLSGQKAVEKKTTKTDEKDDTKRIIMKLPYVKEVYTKRN